MFYSSEAPNGTSTIQPEQTIFAFWKAVKTLWWSEHWRWLWYRQCLRKAAEVSEGIPQKCFLVLQRLSTFHRIFPWAEIATFLLGVAGTLPYLPVWLSHTWLRQDKHHCLLPNISILSTTGVLQFFLTTNTTTAQMSLLFPFWRKFVHPTTTLFCCSLWKEDTISPGFFLSPITMSSAEVTNLSSERRNKTTEPTESSCLLFTFHAATARL